jgi:hypothetical protein
LVKDDQPQTLALRATVNMLASEMALAQAQDCGSLKAADWQRTRLNLL